MPGWGCFGRRVAAAEQRGACEKRQGTVQAADRPAGVSWRERSKKGWLDHHVMLVYDI